MKRRDVTLGLASLTIAMVTTAKSQRIARTARRRSPQVTRLTRKLDGETANVQDYCAADGRQIDTQQFQELIDLRPAAILYPASTALMIDKPIALRSDQSHMFALGSRIDAEVDNYAMSGTGWTSQNLAKLAKEIPRYAQTISLDRVPDVSSGDIILLVNVSDGGNLQVDINAVERVDGETIRTFYEIGRPFFNINAFRIYKVYSPLKNLRFLGKVACLNHHPSGGFLRLTNAVDAEFRGLVIEDAGYIGLSIESSMRTQVNQVAVLGAGASGLGIRASKGVSINGFVAKNVRADESLTFYDNVSHVTATNISVKQQIFQEDKTFQAGSNILIDLLCSKINIDRVSCSGSATYNIMINNKSDDCMITNFRLKNSNLGGIRVSAGSNNTLIRSGSISDVINIYDQEGQKPVSAISIGSTCVGTSISSDIAYQRIASGHSVGILTEKPS